MKDKTIIQITNLVDDIRQYAELYKDSIGSSVIVGYIIKLSIRQDYDYVNNKQPEPIEISFNGQFISPRLLGSITKEMEDNAIAKLLFNIMSEYSLEELNKISIIK